VRAPSCSGGGRLADSGSIGYFGWHARITRTFEGNGWHIAETAERLGISRKNLWEKMKERGIRECAG
jgi:ActR/RegA family two-component response regulator